MFPIKEMSKAIQRYARKHNFSAYVVRYNTELKTKAVRDYLESLPSDSALRQKYLGAIRKNPAPSAKKRLEKLHKMFFDLRKKGKELFYKPGKEKEYADVAKKAKRVGDLYHAQTWHDYPHGKAHFKRELYKRRTNPPRHLSTYAQIEKKRTDRSTTVAMVVARHMTQGKKSLEVGDYLRAKRHALAALHAWDQSHDLSGKNLRGVASKYARHEIIELLSQTVGLKSQYRRGAPSPGERSKKFHDLRKILLKKMQVAGKKGDMKLYDFYGRKLTKLDRIFYAPRNVKRRK